MKGACSSACARRGCTASPPPIRACSNPRKGRSAAAIALWWSAVSDPASPSTPITIVIADDHQVVRAGLRLLLDAEDGFAVVADAGDVASTERRVAAFHPKVLVLDVNMPEGSSLPSIPRLRKAAPETQIVVLTMHNDSELAREALRTGAIGFVLKEAAESELVQAVRLAAEVPRAGPPDDLSERELEVLKLIALGHTNAEIASRLYLSVRTVESHRAHIQQKTQRSSRADLVAYAREHGVL